VTYITRIIENCLADWAKKTDRRPLMLRGARQVGKSSTVAVFGEGFFKRVHTINFERDKSYGEIFKKNLDPVRIIQELEVAVNSKINVGQDLLFFDEIQECPEAISSLRYFYEEMQKLHIISAGSLLEFSLGESSFPVGRVNYLFMYPLSFSEFLNATGRNNLVEYLPNLTTKTVSSEFILTKIYDALKEYFIVGGMPQAVDKFVDTKSYIDVRNIHEDILQSYKDDIPKYCTGEMQIENLSRTFDSVFKFVGSQINYTKLGNGDSSVRTKVSLSLLEKALICKKIRSALPSALPLGAAASEKRFKELFLDIGLGQTAAGLPIENVLQSKNLLATYDGKLAEQFVGQQLLAESSSASEGRNLFCWFRAERSSNAEVDYLIVREGKIIPVEVKSGKSGSLKSLHLLLNQFSTSAKSGLCLQQTDKYGKVDKIEFMPLFTIL
jgi:uncharacterized protein